MGKAFFAGCLLGLLVGVAVDTLGPGSIDEVKIFQREGKPAVMRVSKQGIDNLLVEEKNGKYIPMITHLWNIKNKFDRKIEEVTIKKVVNEAGKSEN